MSPKPPASAAEQDSPGEGLFRLLVESVKDYAIFMLDLQGRVQTWNVGAERAKGYRAAEIVGQHFSRFYTPEDVAAGRPEQLLRVAREEGRVEDEGWRVRKDGSTFWANVLISAVRDEAGRLVGYAKVTRDLTEQKVFEDQLLESELRFRLLVESVQDYAIFMLDTAGRVRTWNTGAEHINGYRAEEIVGQHFSVFYPLEERETGSPEAALALAERDGRFEEEGWRVGKSGTRVFVSVVLTALRGHRGELVGFTKITRDLTERRNAEKERMRLAQADESIRLRDEFLSIAAHELRTPLTALQLNLQSMERRFAPSDGLSTALQRASRSARRLTDLVDSLLDVSRISTGSLPLLPGPFDLSQAVTEVAESLRSTAEEARCSLTVSAEPAIVGTWDRLRIEQVLTNLLSNALKYAAGTPVSVSVSRAPSGVLLQVSDGGKGIPESDLQRVFGRFERAASIQHYGGLGLGLYVSREIVELHGGKLTAENLPAGGARFSVWLPSQP